MGWSINLKSSRSTNIHQVKLSSPFRKIFKKKIHKRLKSFRTVLKSFISKLSTHRQLPFKLKISKLTKRKLLFHLNSFAAYFPLYKYFFFPLLSTSSMRSCCQIFENFFDIAYCFPSSFFFLHPIIYLASDFYCIFFNLSVVSCWKRTRNFTTDLCVTFSFIVSSSAWCAL